MTNSVELLSVAELANSQDKYIVPIYQRNYAWTIDEVAELISDIRNANPSEQKSYYIGSLVVFKRPNGEYEVIDGQQRLTTLKLILAAIEYGNTINLSFEHRESSNYSLNHLKEGSKQNSIEQRFNDIIQLLKEDKEIKENLIKWLGFIKILRAEVPEHTDLNHYFEIMNNRGEQLEKHEIVKAYLMGVLTDEQDRKAFANIWDACSDMGGYVIRNFSKSVREHLFLDIEEQYGKLPLDLNGHLFKKNDGCEFLTVKNILDEKDINISQDKNNDEEYDKFKSVVDFPNFLMITLKCFVKNENISLNDKILYEIFKFYLKEKEDVIKFIVFLLRLRLLFDRYIIKSKVNEEDRWRLYGIKKNTAGSAIVANSFGKAIHSKNIEKDEKPDELQDKLIKIISMFHVSFRTKNYKDWLFDTLKWLDEKSKEKDQYIISLKEYIDYMENQAYEYFENRQKIGRSWNDEILCLGTGFNSYIFNYLDYLLWRDFEEITYNLSDYISKDGFRFSMSSNSVEHYFPQSKKDDLTEFENVERDKIMNNLGNLCLIPNYQNSSLTNDDVEIKRSKYKIKSKKLTCNSIKQAIMLSYENWNSQEIKQHCEEMLEILKKESARFRKLQN